MQVLKIRQRILGPEHPYTLTSMGNLASTYWRQGRWKEAEELELQVMETREIAECRASFHADQHGQPDSDTMESRTVDRGGKAGGAVET